MGRDVSSSSRRVSGQSKPSPAHHRDTGNGPEFISHHLASLAAFQCSALSYSPWKKAVDGVSLGLSLRKNPRLEKAISSPYMTGRPMGSDQKK